MLLLIVQFRTGVWLDTLLKLLHKQEEQRGQTVNCLMDTYLYFTAQMCAFRPCLINYSGVTVCANYDYYEDNDDDDIQFNLTVLVL